MNSFPLPDILQQYPWRFRFSLRPLRDANRRSGGSTEFRICLQLIRQLRQERNCHHSHHNDGLQHFHCWSQHHRYHCGQKKKEEEKAPGECPQQWRAKVRRGRPLSEIHNSPKCGRQQCKSSGIWGSSCGVQLHAFTNGDLPRFLRFGPEKRHVLCNSATKERHVYLNPSLHPTPQLPTTPHPQPYNNFPSYTTTTTPCSQVVWPVSESFLQERGSSDL